MHVAWVTLLLAAQATSPLGDGKIVFLGLGAESGVEAGVAKLLSEMAVTHIQAVHNDVISGSDLESLISAEAARSEFGCDDASCLAEVGMALGARYLAVGGIGLLGSRYILNLKLIDTTQVRVINRVSASNARNVDELIEAIGPAMRKLIGADKPSATREIAASPAAAAEPMPAATVEASKGGGIGGMSIAGFAVAGVGLIGGAVFGVMARGKQSELQDISPPTAAQVATYEDLRSTAKSRALLADLSFGVAAVGAAVGVIGLFMGGEEGDAHARLMITPTSIAVAGGF